MYLKAFLVYFTMKFNLTAYFYLPSIISSSIRRSLSFSSRSKMEDSGRGNIPINKGMHRDITISTN